MVTRIAIASISLVMATVPSLACEINGLTDAINRLKGGSEPTAGQVAMACSKILQSQNPIDSGELAALVLTLQNRFEGDLRLKAAVTNCAPEMYRKAC